MENTEPVTSSPITNPPSTMTPPPSVNQPVPNAPAQGRSTKKLIVIIGCAVLIGVIILAIVLMMVFSKPKNNTTSKNETPVTKNETQDVKTYPKFQFTYGTPPTLTNPKTQLQSYILKSAFSESELASIGANFGFPKVEKKENGFAYYSDFKNPQSRGFLVFNTNTGTFEFTNLSLENKIQNTDIRQGTKEFLTKLGLTDNLTDCSITYKSSVLPDVTYVECHRSWEALGAPLLNLPGVMNIPESKSMSTLKLGYNDTPLESPTITDVSTGQNGVNRPNDFNTATFAIAKDGTILSLMSNLRWIETSSQSALITPDAAFTAFTQNRADQTVAVPADNGSFEWDKVFPTGGVTGKNAEIKDYQLIYIENEPGQSQKIYTPMYLIRGNIMLDTGYHVNFVQTLPAISSSTANIQIAQGVPRNNLQLQTFTTKSTPTSTTPLITAAKTLTPTPSPKPFDCSLDENIGEGAGSIIYGNRLVKFTVKINGANVTMATIENAPNVFFINEKVTTATEVSRYKSELFNLIGRQFAWNYKNGALPNSPSFEGFPTGYGPTDQAKIAVQGVYDSLIKNTTPIENPNLPTLNSVTALSMDPNHVNNPCYLTGLSPTVFLYSNSNKEFIITPSYTVYSLPPIAENSWTAKAGKDGTLTLGSFEKDFLYYEFNPEKVTFNKQEKGFVLSIDDIRSFVPKLAKEMKLNSKESERLHFELWLAVSDLPSGTTHIKISLVPTAELNKKLPLNVSPKTEKTNRYHFTLSKVTKDTKSSKPTIPAVKRGSSTLFEIGASALK